MGRLSVNRSPTERAAAARANWASGLVGENTTIEGEYSRHQAEIGPRL